MVTLALAIAALIAAVEVNVAPDQPIPHIYPDDPLILEFKSDTATQAEVTLEVVPDFGASPVTLHLGTIGLRAHGVRWRAIDGIPNDLGRYQLRARIQTGGEATEAAGGATEAAGGDTEAAGGDTETAGGNTEIAGEATEVTASFCRINRPLPGYSLPVCANLAAVDARVPVALSGISVRTVRLDAGLPGLEDRLAAAAGAGVNVVLALKAGQVEPAAAAAKTFDDHVVAWHLEAGGSPEEFAATAKALHGAGARSDLILPAADADELARLVEAGLGPLMDAVVLRHDWPDRDAIQAVQAAAERAGYEGLALHVALPAPADGDEAGSGPRLARQLVLHAALGVEQTWLDAPWIYTDSFGPGYVYLSALAHLLEGARYAGELNLGEDVTALVFRAGDHWTVAAWTAGDPAEAALKIENATELRLADARNNALQTPEPADGVVALAVDATPRFLSGRAGSVVAQAARAEVRTAAAAFADTPDFSAQLPPQILETVARFAKDSGYDRMDFFDLLKVFPHIEELWHTGMLPPRVAVPALARMARLARALCALEQERGEPFVEPLQNTLANCGQFLSLYLTSSAGASDTRDRANWLMEEVSRLMAEAESLASEGRLIEANAVAVLAEWRARALEIAAKTQPLALPEAPSPKPAVEPAPAETKETKPPAKETKPAPKPATKSSRKKK